MKLTNFPQLCCAKKIKTWSSSSESWCARSFAVVNNLGVLMLQNLKLTAKLPIMMLVACLAMAAASTAISYFSAKQQATEQVEYNWSGILAAKKHELEVYYKSIEQDLRITAGAPTIKQAVKEFSQAWTELGFNQQSRLQKAYITDNPNPTGEKEKLDAASTGSTYDAVHAKYHPIVRKLLQERGYYDIFLFNLSGDLVYSVFKELDYATNLQNGKYRSSDLGNAFRAGLNAKTADTIDFFDFKPYAPSHGAPASFMSIPIIENGNKIGVLVFQMPVDRLNELMTQDTGLGESGETLMIGADYLLRNDSRFSKENDILAVKVQNEAISSALAGETASAEDNAYRNMNIQYVAQPFKYKGKSFALVALESVAEIEAHITAQLYKMLFMTFALLVLIGFLGYLASKSITKPISKIIANIQELAGGNNKVEIFGTDRNDEIGEIANSVLIFKENAIKQEVLQAEADKEQETRLQRQQAVEKLIADFQGQVRNSLETVRLSAEQMEGHANNMSESAFESTERAKIMDESTNQALSYVNAASSAGDEMNAAISEIEGQVVRARDLVDLATRQAEETNARVSNLTEASRKIGEIVNIIQEIAEQTNLLALNATIEAARAGENGKGFAVVASEVKGLATQTANATEEISNQINNIQTETTGSADAIEQVAQKIAEINEFTSGIASAIEEQAAATNEIARNVQSTAEKTQEVSNNVGQVASSIGVTDEAAP